MERCSGVAAEVVGVGEIVRRWRRLSASDPQGGAVFSTGYPQLRPVVSWPIVNEKLTITSVQYLMEAMTRHIAAEIIIR